MENLELLSKVALSFQDINNFDNDMKQVLKDIGSYIDVSRIYIFLNESKDIVSNTFEWYNEGVTPQIQYLQKFYYKYMPSWQSILQNKGYICSDNIMDLPQDIIDTLKDQQIKSLIVYPMINDKIEGFIGFDECRYKRRWKEEELKILSTASKIIANAYKKKSFQQNILESEIDFDNSFEKLDNRGKPYHPIANNIEVSKKYEEALETEHFFSINPDLFFIADMEGKFIKTNKAWGEILGYTSEELKGRKLIEFVNPDDLFKTLKVTEQLGTQWETTKLVNRCINREGDYRYIEWRANQYESSIYASGRDITDQIKHEKQILELSNRDCLTNLYNRRYVYYKAEEIIREYKETGKIFSLCIIDIDDFKNVNDKYGHQIGDYVLKEFTKILDENLRPDDILGRYGGEEFIIILRNINQKKSNVVIDRILNIIRNKTFIINKEEIKISFSAGISDCMEMKKEKLTMDNLVGIADSRMYKAKNIGKNKIIATNIMSLEI